MVPLFFLRSSASSAVNCFSRITDSGVLGPQVLLAAAHPALQVRVHSLRGAAQQALGGVRARPRAGRGRLPGRRSAAWAAPLWRAPSSSPGPRMRRSWRAISKPSLCSYMMRRRSRALSDSGFWYSRMQTLACAPRPTRPRNWCICDKPHALGVLDHHERRVRHIHAHFDHGGRDQQLHRRPP